MEKSLNIQIHNKLRKMIKELSQLKKWDIVENSRTDTWFLYYKDELALKIKVEYTNNVILKFYIPFVNEVNTSSEILLRNLLLEKDIRKELGENEFILKSETIYIFSTLTLKIRKMNSGIIFCHKIQELQQLSELLGTILNAKLLSHTIINSN